MSDFVTKPGAPVPAVETPIVRTGFFPTIDVAALRLAQRVPTTVTPERLRDATIDAIMSTDADLAAWSLIQIAAGNATLADVPADQIDGVSRYVQLYRRAVGCRAKAELVERYRDVDTTGSGDRRTDALDRTPDELRRDATHAVRAILGDTPAVVELI